MASHSRSPSSTLLSAVLPAAPVATTSNVLPSVVPTSSTSQPYALASSSTQPHTPKHISPSPSRSSRPPFSMPTNAPRSPTQFIQPGTSSAPKSSDIEKQSRHTSSPHYPIGPVSSHRTDPATTRPSSLLPFTELSEKRPHAPTSSQSHGPLSRTMSVGHLPRRSRSRRSSCYPPDAANSPSNSGCTGCGWFIALPPRVRLWLSFAAWGATTVGFIIAIAFWKAEVFNGTYTVAQRRAKINVPP